MSRTGSDVEVIKNETLLTNTILSPYACFHFRSLVVRSGLKRLNNYAFQLRYRNYSLYEVIQISLLIVIPNIYDFLRYARAIEELAGGFEIGFRHPLSP
jgi:hypothetical protein